LVRYVEILAAAGTMAKKKLKKAGADFLQIFIDKLKGFSKVFELYTIGKILSGYGFG